MIWIALILVLTAIDRISKYVIVKNVEYMEQIKVIDNFLYITYHRNSGAAWGIFQNGRLFFIIITIVFLFAIIYYFIKMKNSFLRTSLSLIISGALGNLIGRIIEGNVVDFIDVYIFGYDFPVFNFADSLLTVGTILLAVYILFFYEEAKPKADKT